MNSIVGNIRILTRRTPLLYAKLAKFYHELIFQIERFRIHQKYAGVKSVRFDESTLKKIKDNGFQSQFGQDYFLYDQGLVPKKSGIFLDIGCNDPVISSNSYYFEKNCNYKGVAIDPLNDFGDKWAKERDNTIFVNAFVSNTNDEIDFIEVSGSHGWENKLSGAAGKVRLDGKNINTKTRKIRPLKLQDILVKTGFDFGVDILSVDVEGYEIEVLSSVDWSVKKPQTIVIENTGSWKDQEKLRSFIIDKGYKYYSRVSIVDDIFVKI